MGQSADEWLHSAACATGSAKTFFRAQPAEAQEICAGCSVRPECLHEALELDVSTGVWGGLTPAERRALPPLPSERAAAIASLRAHLADQELRRAHPEKAVTVKALQTLLTEIDQQGGPQAAREGRLHLATIPPAERTSQTMTDTDTRTVQPAPATTPAPLPEYDLLVWGDTHLDSDVQDQAARARALLAALRGRHSADQELDAITAEAEALQTRLTELQERKAQLVPAKPKSKQPPAYPAAEVRAWAKEQGLPCPATGRVPKKVVDAWRAATGADPAATS